MHIFHDLFIQFHYELYWNKRSMIHRTPMTRILKNVFSEEFNKFISSHIFKFQWDVSQRLSEQNVDRRNLPKPFLHSYWFIKMTTFNWQNKNLRFVSLETSRHLMIKLPWVRNIYILYTSDSTCFKTTTIKQATRKMRRDSNFERNFLGFGLRSISVSLSFLLHMYQNHQFFNI